jgi:signal transduction histidine kinase
MQQGRVDLNQLVRNAVSLAEPEARQHGINLRLDLDGEIPPVEIDSVQIEQVVLNLLNNAIEAMTDSPTNGTELAVRSSVEKDSMVRIAVTDSGKSISPSMIDRVFEPFYTTKTHGLGMGLAISRSIVESHGGRMWAVLNPGGGMTFQFTLPGSL